MNVGVRNNFENYTNSVKLSYKMFGYSQTDLFRHEPRHEPVVDADDVLRRDHLHHSRNFLKCKVYNFTV